MRYVLIALFCLACVSPAHGASQVGQAAETVSFAELYRMTVAEEYPAQLAAQFPEHQARVTFASTAAAEPAAPRYSISTAVLPEPSSRWLLLLSGLALAFWVARRRLGYSL